MCKYCIDLFKKEGRELPTAICVSNLKNNDELLDGISIISVDELFEKYSDYYVLVTTAEYAKEVIEVNLKNFDLDKILFFGAYGSFDDTMANVREYLIENENKLTEINDNLFDEKSKEIFMPILLGRFYNSYDVYEKYYSPNQYFQDDIYKIKEDEVFLDVGSFTGDTIEILEDITNGKYKKVIAFEPNKDNYIYIEKMMETNSKIKLIKKGVSDKKETLLFSSNSSSSSFNENGDIKIEVDTIDNLIDEEITFIKMDIEGFEMNALNGAINMIKKYKPTLAICIYHKYTDFVDIPEFILNLNLGYKLYVRHHTKNFGETVLYAVI